MTKPLPWHTLRIHVEPLMFWKGETVVPATYPIPQGSDGDASLESRLPVFRAFAPVASVETPSVANEPLSPNSNRILNSNTYGMTFDTYGKTFYG